MTLTQQDLQSIDKLLEQNLDQKLNEKLNFYLKKELKPIKTTLNRVQKDLDWVIGKYDSRLNHLEKHVTHPPHRITD